MAETNFGLKLHLCLQQTSYRNKYMLTENCKGKTTMIQKDHLKGIAPNNYRPITCLPMMWKILTAQIREKIYYSLRIPQGDQGHKKTTVYRSTHPQQE